MSDTKNKLHLDDLPDEIKEHIFQLERIRTDFVANVSHELRTPLTVIRGYLEALLQKDNVDIQVLHKIYQQMYQHSVRMENIINGLLFLSRLECEEQPLSENVEIKVAEVLKTLCTDAQRISADKKHHITLEADAHLTIHGSEEEFKSLFSNIIVNAVKYTPANGQITVSWHQEGDYAVFSVTDTGIGIESEHIPRLTERFYRVDKARSRESGGTGLGLAIVKHVLMRHQGTLHIESIPGTGSTFTCKFLIN